MLLQVSPKTMLLLHNVVVKSDISYHKMMRTALSVFTNTAAFCFVSTRRSYEDVVTSMGPATRTSRCSPTSCPPTTSQRSTSNLVIVTAFLFALSPSAGVLLQFHYIDYLNLLGVGDVLHDAMMRNCPLYRMDVLPVVVDASRSKEPGRTSTVVQDTNFREYKYPKYKNQVQVCHTCTTGRLLCMFLPLNS